MENFQQLSRFLLLALPGLASLGFAACTVDEGAGGNGAGSGGMAQQTGGSASGAAGPIAGSTSPGGGGSGAGQVSTSGATSGGAGASSGGQPSSGSNAGGTAGAAVGGGGGSSGSGGGAPVMGCAGFTGKFCDDFEGQMDGKAPAGAFKVSGPVLVDSSKAYSGTKSIKITKPSPTGQLQFSQQFPMTDLHGRAMFFVSKVPTGNTGPHWDLVVAVADNGTNWEIGGMYGKFLFIVDPPDTGVDSVNFPTGKWFCLQWQYKHVPGSPTFVAKMDNTTLPNGEFTGKDPDGHTWNSGPWNNLAIGFTSYGSNVDTEVWVDDLAFGDTPIACPPLK